MMRWHFRPLVYILNGPRVLVPFQVNNIVQATVDGSDISFEWKDCTPCVTYDFQLKVR